MLAELLLGLTTEASRRVHDLRPAAVVEGHEQGDAPVGAGLVLRPLDPAQQLGVEAVPPADEAHPNALVVELGRLAVDALGEHRHQPLHLLRRAVPVLRREGEDRQLLDAELDGVLQPRLDDVRPGLVPLDDRQPLRLRPAPVAVGDDGDVARAGSAHTSRISASLPASSLSISPTRASVSFCSSDSARCSSSDPTSPSLFRPRRSCWTSRRMLRTATRPCSAMLCTIFTRSRRRSSVSSGMESLITLPSLFGVNPMSDSRIAFSICLIEFLSYGVIVSSRASVAETCDSWLSGVT